MKTLKSSILISFLILCISCSTNKEAETVDKAQIEGEVAEVLNAYREHVTSKGLQGVESYFSKDERFYWVEDGVLQYPNRAALVEGIEQFSPTVTSVNLQTFDKKITVIDINSATLYVEYKQEITLTSGFAFTLDGAMTILLIREDDSWKFLIGHSSIKKPRGGNQY